jgi:hypothetical protein
MRDRRSHVRHSSITTRSIFGKNTTEIKKKRHVVFLPFIFLSSITMTFNESCSIDRLSIFNASATQISKWRHRLLLILFYNRWIDTYLCTLKIFYQKKGTRWKCWHIHYVVYRIIKLNKWLKDVKKTLSSLRLYIFFLFNSISFRLYTRRCFLYLKETSRWCTRAHWFFIRLKFVVLSFPISRNVLLFNKDIGWNIFCSLSFLPLKTTT